MFMLLGCVGVAVDVLAIILLTAGVIDGEITSNPGVPAMSILLLPLSTLWLPLTIKEGWWEGRR